MTDCLPPGPATRIPPAIAEVFTELKAIVIETHFRWLTYRELFAISQTRVDLLNECAGPFFVILHDILLSDVQLDLCKLTDPARTLRLENLSLDQLQERMASHGDSSLAGRCDTLLVQVHAHAVRFRHRRNKKLAHIDLATALGTAATPLPEVTRKSIDDTLQAVRAYMNAIEDHYDGAQTGYEYSIIHKGSAAIVARLQDSRRYHEHIRAGRLPIDDWRHGREADNEDRRVLTVAPDVLPVS
jgi:hypothetical protein